jgi:GWxTD domain-containing protein
VSDRPARTVLACAVLAAVLVLACTSRNQNARPVPVPVSTIGLNRVPIDPLAAYRQAGFLVAGEPFPLVGAVHALASPSADSTLILVTFSMPNRVLTFTRDGEQYHASYNVRLELRRDSTLVHGYEGREIVRVASFRETSRGEESVIFQKYFPVAPGHYTLAVRAIDSTSGRFAATTAGVDVPRYEAGSATAPIAVYEAGTRTDRAALPALIPNPRSTAVFGRDTILTFYFESYGAKDSSLLPLRVIDQRKRTVFAETVRVTRHGQLLSGTTTIPVARLGLGATFMELQSPGGANVPVPLIVSLGEGLAVTTFEEMLEYLRYYATAERLRALRDTTPEERAVAWARFLRETDPTPATIEHEGLRNYFQNLAEANARFRDEGMAGWMTDRGMVYATLGEPDNVVEPSGPRSTERGRTQLWEYSRHRVQLVFTDKAGVGKWRLTPSSEAEFLSVARHVRVQ